MFTFAGKEYDIDARAAEAIVMAMKASLAALPEEIANEQIGKLLTSASAAAHKGEKAASAQKLTALQDRANADPNVKALLKATATQWSKYVKNVKALGEQCGLDFKPKTATTEENFFAYGEKVNLQKLNEVFGVYMLKRVQDRDDATKYRYLVEVEVPNAGIAEWRAACGEVQAAVSKLAPTGLSFKSSFTENYDAVMISDASKGTSPGGSAAGITKSRTGKVSYNGETFAGTSKEVCDWLTAKGVALPKSCQQYPAVVWKGVPGVQIIEH